MYIKYSSDRLKYKDDDWKLLRFNPLCESKSFSIESNRVVQRYPNNKHRRVSYRIQNFLLEPLRDERGRGKEINKEYNFVRVIHRSNTPCANTYNPIDRSIDMSSSTDRKHNGTAKKQGEREMSSFSRELRGRNRARYVLSHVSTYNDWQRSRRDRGAHDPLHRFSAAQRDGTEDISSKYLSIQLRGNRSVATRRIYPGEGL